MGTFLAAIRRQDKKGVLRHLLFKRQLAVLDLIENKWLCDCFRANSDGGYEQDLRQLVRCYLREFGQRDMLPIFQVVFQRIYIMRLRVFHGASTKGSSLGRRMLNECTAVLFDLLSPMIEVMIRNGLSVDWGSVWFPPMNMERRRKSR